MKIRKATEEDLEKVVEFWRKFMSYHEEYHSRYITLKDEAEQIFKRDLRENLEDDEELILIAEDEGKKIGYVSASVEEHPEIFQEEKIGKINELYVEKNHIKRSGRPF